MNAQPGPETRAARIADLRRRIAAGTYESPDKLHAAAERLVAEAAVRLLTEAVQSKQANGSATRRN